MTKLEFLYRLQGKLSSLPQKEIAERLAFYGEMIDDHMEEGLSEEEAVRQVGDMDSIIEQIIMESAGTKDREESKKKVNAWLIVLLVLGAPLWLPLLIAAGAVITAGYVTVWSVVIFLWATEVSFWGAALGGLVSGVAWLCSGNAVAGMTMLGVGAICAGLSVFWFCGCRAATKGIGLLSNKVAVGIKKLFVKGEVAE